MGLQEIGCSCSGWDNPLRVRHCSEELRFSCVSIFKDHNGGDVAAAIAVVRSRPHCDQLLIEHELVAFVDKLVCPADQLQVVDVNKLQFLKDGERKKRKYVKKKNLLLLLLLGPTRSLRGKVEGLKYTEVNTQHQVTDAVLTSLSFLRFEVTFYS